QRGGAEPHAGAARQLSDRRARANDVSRGAQLGRGRLGRERASHARARGDGRGPVPRLPAVDGAHAAAPLGSRAHAGIWRVTPGARPRLRELARRLGFVEEYIDMVGQRVAASDDTCERILSVMGIDAPTEDAAAGWLAELDHEDATTLVQPVRVTR